MVLHDSRRHDAVRILAAAAGVVLVEAAVAVSASSLDAGLLAFVRVTARTSLVWFALAFAASPLVALRPTPASKWLLRNRRSLGLAMAITHGAHLVGISILAARHGAAFWSAIAPSTLIGGGLGYLILAAMVATSTDRSLLRLGRRRWRALHLTGMWWFWLIFMATYSGQLAHGVFAWLATAGLVALAGLRLVVAIQRAARARLTRGSRSPRSAR
ncbi:MAG: ferric reductase-like transmembrane domain-containing protein [Myxococcales bacterium]|nr:ferric reductase-like transmembrane domain-containing protein [Myxococcales bacterium]